MVPGSVHMLSSFVGLIEIQGYTKYLILFNQLKNLSTYPLNWAQWANPEGEVIRTDVEFEDAIIWFKTLKLVWFMHKNGRQNI